MIPIVNEIVDRHADAITSAINALDLELAAHGIYLNQVTGKGACAKVEMSVSTWIGDQTGTNIVIKKYLALDSNSEDRPPTTEPASR